MGKERGNGDKTTNGSISPISDTIRFNHNTFVSAIIHWRMQLPNWIFNAWYNAKCCYAGAVFGFLLQNVYEKRQEGEIELKQ